MKPVLFSLLLSCLCLACSKQEDIPAREVLPDLPWVTPSAEAPNTQQVLFPSPSVGEAVSFHIYLPDEYAEDSTQRFPVLYWLHGGGGGLDGIRPLVQHFRQAMQSGSVPPFIIVFPNGLPHGMWCDSKDGRQPVERMFIDDLLPYVDAHYRTIAARRGRIVEGFSMGGYGAARFGFKYGELFGGFSLMGAGPLQLDFSVVSPGNQALQPRIFKEVYGEDMAYFEAQSPWRLAEQYGPSLPHPTPKRIVVGTADYVLQNNLNFHELLEGLGIPCQLHVFPGIGHSMPPLLQALGEANWGFYRAVFE